MNLQFSFWTRHSPRVRSGSRRGAIPLALALGALLLAAPALCAARETPASETGSATTSSAGGVGHRLEPASAGTGGPRAGGVLPVHAASELPGLLALLSQGRPLVLHFCATWCTTCRQEFRALRGLLTSLDGRGVSVALVWIDDAQTRAAIPGMTRRYRLERLPALALEAPDPDAVARLLGEPTWDGALPATFVYDIHQGKIASFLGAADRTRLEAAVERARQGKR